MTTATVPATTRTNLPWSTKEDTFLRNHYPKMSAKQVGEKLGRSKYAVQSRARKLKTKSSLFRHWTKDDYKFLQKNYGSLGDHGVSEALGRSESDVHHQAQLLNLTYLKPDNWGEMEETLLRRFYRSATDKSKLSALIGRSEIEVEKRARELNLKTEFFY